MVSDRPLSPTRKDGTLSAPAAPPFEEGNVAARRHGAYSPREIAAKSQEVHDALIEFAPWLDKPHFAPALARYLEAAGRERLLNDYIAEVCADPKQGPGRIPVRLWESAASTTRLAAKLGDDLGLSPLGHARIAVLSGAALQVGAKFDLARAWAEDVDDAEVVE